MVSMVVAVVLDDPGPKFPMVTPCNFMQLRYEANAELFAPAPPPAPLGWRLAHAWIAFWNLELPPKAPAPAGGFPPAPVGGAPPDGGVPLNPPEGGPPPLAPFGKVTPCFDRHDWNADVERVPVDDPLEVVDEAPLLLPHAAIRTPEAANPSTRTRRIGACHGRLRNGVVVSMHTRCQLDLGIPSGNLASFLSARTRRRACTLPGHGRSPSPRRRSPVPGSGTDPSTHGRLTGSPQ